MTETVTQMHSMTMAQADVILDSINYSSAWSFDELLDAIEGQSEASQVRVIKALEMRATAARLEAEKLRRAANKGPR